MAAGPAAVPVLTHRSIEVPIHVLFVVVGMAAGAVRLIGRMTPGDGGAVPSVTVGAEEIPSVISRVRSSGMIEIPG